MSCWWVWQKKGILGWGDDSNTTSIQWRYFSINSVPLLNECKAQELFISYEWIISNPDQRQKQQWFLSLRKQNNTPGLSGKFLFHPAPDLRHYQLKNTNKKPSVLRTGLYFPFSSAGLNREVIAVGTINLFLLLILKCQENPGAPKSCGQHSKNHNERQRMYKPVNKSARCEVNPRNGPWFVFGESQD